MHNPASIPKAFERRSGSRPPMVPLDRLQQQTWEEARTGMLVTAPAMSHIFYSLMNPRQNSHVAYFCTGCLIAATDGVNLFLNPEVALGKNYSLGNRIFMCAHEILQLHLQSSRADVHAREARESDLPGRDRTSLLWHGDEHRHGLRDQRHADQIRHRRLSQGKSGFTTSPLRPARTLSSTLIAS